MRQKCGAGAGYIITCLTTFLTLHTYTSLREHLSPLTMENKRPSTELAKPSMARRFKPRRRLDYVKISDNLMNIVENKSLQYESLSPIMTRSVHKDLLRGASESPALQLAPENAIKS